MFRVGFDPAETLPPVCSRHSQHIKTIQQNRHRHFITSVFKACQKHTSSKPWSSKSDDESNNNTISSVYYSLQEPQHNVEANGSLIAHLYLHIYLQHLFVLLYQFSLQPTRGIDPSHLCWDTICILVSEGDVQTQQVCLFFCCVW